MNEYRWEDLKVGLAHDFSVVLTEDMLRAFASLSGDENPLHVDPEHAVKAGFRGPVAHGLLTSALYSRLVGMYLPGRHALLHGIDVDFVSPAYAGDKLHVSGEVTFLSEAYFRVEMRARIKNEAGKAISRAKIRVGLHVVA